MANDLQLAPSNALAMGEDELIDVLTASLYPGASRPSVRLVLGYCRAAGLDPMQKPVHIVPMWDSKAGQMRDVVMPGVGLYRTQASRTGTFAGQSEPEFGPMVDGTVGGAKISYPEWARVTVKKMMPGGLVAEFTAVEYWLENYAVKGGKEKSVAPNAMWTKRPRGQIAKCAAAQALRLAFPEMGAQPTAEEMEGKTMNEDVPAPTLPPAASGKAVCAEALAAMPAEQQEAINAIAAAVVEAFAAGGGVQAKARLDAENLDSEEKKALWSKLPSALRTWLKGASVQHVLTAEEKSTAEDAVMYLIELSGEEGEVAAGIRVFYELPKQVREFAWHLLEDHQELRAILNANNPLKD